MPLARSRPPLGVVLVFAFLSCNPGDGVAPRPRPPSLAGVQAAVVAAPVVRFSELHYDNVGTDAGEAIEISGPAGTDLTGWQVVLYNGSGGASYNTTVLTGAIPATCGARGVVAITYPVNGIQNGSPDGIALINGAGGMVEFLSYEGTFTAVGGPANGVLSTDIGVSEAGTEPLGQSLQRNGAGTWAGPAASTFGACNDDDEPPPPPPPPPDTRLSEIHYDNASTDVGEAIEIEGPGGADLTGWRVVLYNGSGGAAYSTQTLSGTIVARCSGRGVVVIAYPSNGIQNGSPDGVALVDAGGSVVEFLSYEGAFVAADGPAAGTTSRDIGVSEAGTEPVGLSLQRRSTGTWQAPAPATFERCNEGDEPPPPPSPTIAFSGRFPSDVPLPVGFEDQFFATLLDGAGQPVPTTITWATETPAIASVDQNGVVHAFAAGTAILRATAAEGTTGTWSLPTRVAVQSGTALYAGNAEFGEPADGDPSDDFIVRHRGYAASYNHNRGTPNWVSYDLDPSHFGPEDRCDCFTFDPALPPAFTRYTTADYTGAGAIAGYGIDRGHLAGSFDRTAGSLDNAFTFLFTNIVPQASDLNQGPWASMENFLGDLARFAPNKEVYIIAGPAGSKGTVKNEGRITIPTSTWKVAVILDHDEGLADVHTLADLEVIAVIMPNDPGVRNVNWETYKTTVDAVEAVSGYDLLDRLPDPIEIAVESNTKPPVAATDGPYSSLPNLAVAMSAGRSTDPDGDALTYTWTFGDGGAGAGVAVGHTYASPGTYTVRMIVTDIRGLADTVETTATVLTSVQGVQGAMQLVDDFLARGALSARDGAWLTLKLGLAIRLLDRGLTTAAVNQLEEVLRNIDTLERNGQLDAGDAGALRTAVERVIQSVSP